MSRMSFGVVVGLTSALSAGSVNGVVVYDNSTTFAGTHNELLSAGQANSTEHGNEVTLAGTERVVTQITVFLGITCCGPATFDSRIRFYTNDGLDGRPSTLLWESDLIPQIIDSGNPDAIPIAYSFDVPEIAVPSTFTWTIQVLNRTSNMATMGPSHFGPPAVGNAPFGFWRPIGGPTEWEFTGLDEPPFGGQVLAVAGKAIPATSKWGITTFALLIVAAATVAFRRRVAKTV